MFGKRIINPLAGAFGTKDLASHGFRLKGPCITFPKAGGVAEGIRVLRRNSGSAQWRDTAKDDRRQEHRRQRRQDHWR
ncbi:hypothetical protein [Streptomyces sp. NPDC014734]|uniref:hypothetical protein n=1 Tax=Streptomyces sp. NPDC014734 TaxID=3364886 RepID=UPI0036FE34DE